MAFWIFMTLMNALIPAIILGFGHYFKNHQPEHISYFFGYRTPRSMKNKETWTFAHKKLGELWSRIGWYILAPSILMMLPFIRSDEDTIALVASTFMILEALALLASIVVIEKALRRNFDKDGNRIHFD